MAELGSAVTETKKTLWDRMRALFPQPAPPAPRAEVKDLFAQVRFSQGDIAKVFHIYQKLRAEDGNLRTRARQLTLHSSAVINVVNDHRIYVEVLLKNVLQLGGCTEFIDWDRFVYIFVQFCSLTKVELCQLMFLFIVRESRGLDIHYLTSMQLDRFYDLYRPESGVLTIPVAGGGGPPPPPGSMLCSRIHFSNFPLSRYYITDFVEICFLYSQLISPLIYLQRQFRRVIPSLRFWDTYENTSLIGSRRINLDYFMMKKTRVDLLHEDENQFMETTDLLLLSSYIIQKEILSERHPPVSEGSAWKTALGTALGKPQGDQVYQPNLLIKLQRPSDQVGARIDVDLLYNQDQPSHESAILRRRVDQSG